MSQNSSDDSSSACKYHEESSNSSISNTTENWERHIQKSYYEDNCEQKGDSFVDYPENSNAKYENTYNEEEEVESNVTRTPTGYEPSDDENDKNSKTDEDKEQKEWDKIDYYTCKNCYSEYSKKKLVSKASDFVQSVPYKLTKYYQFDSCQNVSRGSKKSVKTFTWTVIEDDGKENIFTVTHEGYNLFCDYCAEKIGWVCSKTGEGHDNDVDVGDSLFHWKRIVQIEAKKK